MIQSSDERVKQTDIPSRTIRQRHIFSGFHLINFGLDADLPSGSTEVQSYFATDTNKLYIFNGTAWVSVLLS